MRDKAPCREPDGELRAGKNGMIGSGSSEHHFAGDVAVVILNYNNASDTIDCVYSLIGPDNHDSRIIVIDNGSNDDNRSRLDQALGSQINLIKLEENVGVAAGWNIAVKIALEENRMSFVFFLNNDTFVEPGVIDELVRFAETSSDIGAVGPTIVKFHLRTEHEYPRHRDIEQPIPDKRLSGCALLIRREVFEDIGLFDEDFFAYAEESDFLERMNQKGWLSYYVPTAAKICHKGSTTSSSISGFEAFHRTRNRLLFAAKNLEGMRLLVNIGSFFFKTLPLDLCRDLTSRDRGTRLRCRFKGFTEGTRLFIRHKF